MRPILHLLSIEILCWVLEWKGGKKMLGLWKVNSNRIQVYTSMCASIVMIPWSVFPQDAKKSYQRKAMDKSEWYAALLRRVLKYIQLQKWKRHHADKQPRRLRCFALWIVKWSTVFALRSPITHTGQHHMHQKGTDFKAIGLNPRILYC